MRLSIVHQPNEGQGKAKEEGEMVVPGIRPGQEMTRLSQRRSHSARRTDKSRHIAQD